MHGSCKSLDQVMTEWIVTVLAMSRTINDVLSKQNLLVANNFGRVDIVWTIVKYNIFAVTINYRKLYHWCIDFLFAKTLWLEITKQWWMQHVSWLYTFLSRSSSFLIWNTKGFCQIPVYSCVENIGNIRWYNQCDYARSLSTCAALRKHSWDTHKNIETSKFQVQFPWNHWTAAQTFDSRLGMGVG